MKIRFATTVQKKSIFHVEPRPNGELKEIMKSDVISLFVVTFRGRVRLEPRLDWSPLHV